MRKKGDNEEEEGGEREMELRTEGEVEDEEEGR